MSSGSTSLPGLLRHLLVADAGAGLLLELVEVHVVVPHGGVGLHGDVHEAEADRTGPDGACHARRSTPRTPASEPPGFRAVCTVPCQELSGGLNMTLDVRLLVPSCHGSHRARRDRERSDLHRGDRRALRSRRPVRRLLARARAAPARARRLRHARSPSPSPATSRVALRTLRSLATATGGRDAGRRRDHRAPQRGPHRRAHRGQPVLPRLAHAEQLGLRAARQAVLRGVASTR